MTFSAAEIKEALYKLLPDGPIWPKLSGDAPEMDALFDGISEEPARVLVRVEDLKNESFPDRAVELLSDWENFFGLSSTGLSLAQRQAAAKTAMLGAGGANVQTLLGIGTGYGYSPEITTDLYQMLQAGFRAGRAANGVWAGYTYGYHYNAMNNHTHIGGLGVVPSAGDQDPWGNSTIRWTKTSTPTDTAVLIFRYTTAPGNWWSSGETWRGVVWLRVLSGLVEWRDNGMPVQQVPPGDGWYRLSYDVTDSSIDDFGTLSTAGDCVVELSTTMSWEHRADLALESVISASSPTPGVVEFRALGDTYVL